MAGPSIFRSVLVGVALGLAGRTALASVPIMVVEATPTYKLTQEISLGVPDNWGDLAYEAGQNRVYVAHDTEVTVVDISTASVIRRLTGFDGALGIVIAPQLRRGFVASRSTNSITVFDIETLKRVSTVHIGSAPDVLVWDPVSRRLFAINREQGIVAVVDVLRNVVIGTVPLDGKPAFAVADSEGKLYISFADKAELASLDVKTRKIDTWWPTPSCPAPQGLGYDRSSRLLYSSCANSALIAISTTDGRVTANYEIGKGSGTTVIDEKIRYVFNLNAEGKFSIVRIGGNWWSSYQTPYRARAMGLDPESGRIFVITGDGANDSPPDGAATKPTTSYVPGSLKLLVLDHD